MVIEDVAADGDADSADCQGKVRQTCIAGKGVLAWNSSGIRAGNILIVARYDGGIEVHKVVTCVCDDASSEMVLMFNLPEKLLIGNDSPNIPQLVWGIVPSGNRALILVAFQDPPVSQLSSTEIERNGPTYLVALMWPKSQVPVPHLSMAMAKKDDPSCGRSKSRKVDVPMARRKRTSAS